MLTCIAVSFLYKINYLAFHIFLNPSIFLDKMFTKLDWEDMIRDFCRTSTHLDFDVLILIA